LAPLSAEFNASLTVAISSPLTIGDGARGARRTNPVERLFAADGRD